MITVTIADKDISDLIFTQESAWSRDGKLIVHEIQGADEDIKYPNGRTSAVATLSGRMINNPTNNALLWECLHEKATVTSDAKGTHADVLVVDITVTQNGAMWTYFNWTVSE